ncbi:MAG: hypothetical protein EA421_05370 [Gemmatimonadales bacterium]|nr:MAG: hypothetical protein EA421_05370 [Gemmatimonadales bacterium]
MNRVDPTTGEILVEAREESPAGSNGTSLARHHPQSAGAELQLRQRVSGLLTPVETPAAILEAREATRRTLAETLQEGKDFGEIPGTSKRTLLQPGAHEIAGAFGCYIRDRVTESEIDHDRRVPWQKRRKRWKGKRFDGWEVEEGESIGLYRYVVRAEIVDRATGVVIGEGTGSCSTLEDRYVDRPRDLEHTVRTMAGKRAAVRAVLSTFGLFDYFQDLEEAREEREELPPEEQIRIARGRYYALLAELIPNPQIRELTRAAFQSAHPNLPDSSTEWQLAHFERATEDLERKGAQILARALDLAAEADPATETSLSMLEKIRAEDDGRFPERTELLRWLSRVRVGAWISAAMETVRAERTAVRRQSRSAKASDQGEIPDQATGGPEEDDLPF